MRVLRCGLFFGLLLACLVGCKVERPKNVLSDAQMENVLYDFHIAKAMGEEMPSLEGYERALLLEAVYRKHGIVKADFDSSMVWFARNPETLSKIYVKVNERLKAQQEEINNLVAIRDNRPKESQPGDSIDVWIWKRIHLLTGMPLDNKLTFTLPSDSNFYDRNTLRWNVRYSFLQETPDSLHAPFMALQVTYDSDTTLNASCYLRRAGMETLTLHADTLGQIKEISGFIYYPMQASASHGLLIDSVSLMRYHATDTLTWNANSAAKEEEMKEKTTPKAAEKPAPKALNEQTPQPRTARPRPASVPTNTSPRKPSTEKKMTAPAKGGELFRSVDDEK